MEYLRHFRQMTQYGYRWYVVVEYKGETKLWLAAQYNNKTGAEYQERTAFLLWAAGAVAQGHKPMLTVEVVGQGSFSKMVPVVPTVPESY